MTDVLDGALTVFKPAGVTSHDVVDQVRRAFGVRAGHAGTLDPMAIGVLVLFLNRGLKLLQYIPAQALDKTYLARVTLGRTTDTYDACGETTSIFQQPISQTKEQILDTLRSFVGEYRQKPPSFSAVKVKGKRAYDLARQGVALDLPERPVHVSSIRLIRDYEAGGFRHLVLRIHCSRGTYIRSLAHDLGQHLGCGAHLSYLLRERVGVWSIHQSVPPRVISRRESFIHLPGFMPLAHILPYPRVTISAEAEARIRHGNPLDPRDIRSISAEHPPTPEDGEDEGLVQIFSGTGSFLALYKPDKSRSDRGQSRLQPVRILV